MAAGAADGEGPTAPPVGRHAVSGDDRRSDGVAGPYAERGLALRPVGFAVAPARLAPRSQGVVFAARVVSGMAEERSSSGPVGRRRRGPRRGTDGKRSSRPAPGHAEDPRYGAT